jgi:hypothetical protein
LKIIKSLPNWIQIRTTIYFPFVCCHQGISVPRMTIDIGSYLSPSISCKIIIRHQLLVNLTLFLFSILNLLQPPKCSSRSSVPITRCHALLQPSATHMSRLYLHVKHISCTHAHKQSIHLSNHPIISCSSIHHSPLPSHPIEFKRSFMFLCLPVLSSD